MANEDYRNGSDGRVFSTPPGGSTPIELDVNTWELTINSNNKDVSGTRVGRFRIAGVPDASGSLSMYYDPGNSQTDDTPTTGPNIRAGSILKLVLVEDGGDASTLDSFRLDAIVDTVKPDQEFDGTMGFDVTFSLQKGSTLKYPGDA